ncbi:hypothetical protein SPBR_05027 [Sporothrix brasiliensis 5110]|uniref:Uncharacterized protein n=1 Tax=Sporothrix brasiliensis 5110 TaxID=1398154 RepID=A0A0C2IL31_9PEZI|nr:uncharacterized protein SPBR_05027 [Sporothrix brasiliensis 5110]KIH87680.1 hypothetical protein SPBR_05027 [Sporothrix brasiliensis 5110]
MVKGKPGSSPLLRPDGDAVSLHSTHGSSSHAAFLDADEDAPELFLDGDDMPPLYTDVVSGNVDDSAVNAETEGSSAAGGRSAGAPSNGRFRYPSYVEGEPQKWRYDIGHFGTEDPAQALATAATHWAQAPPRPYVQLVGKHKQTVDHNGKKETRDVVDFDVKVELTPYLFSDAVTYKSWRTLRTPENRDKVRRGTVFRCQAPAASGPPRLPEDPESNAAVAADGDDDKPTLEDWCRRYTEDPAKLRSFTLERRMVGFDYKKVQTQMESLVRRTNYRGHLAVTFPTDEVGLVMYSDHRFNRWRMMKWVQALCVLTLMVLFTWPYLFFATKSYEVVTVDWPFSRTTPEGRKEYVSLSEDQWYNMWARAITKAVLGKRQGTLDQDDLRQAEGAEPTFESTGNSTVDGALGFVRAGITAMNSVNRQLGWGGDC